MTPYLLVTGDFVPTGGMDRANLALADYLTRRGGAVHLVTHRVDVSLSQKSNVHVHRVPRWLGSNLLAAPWLDRSGRYWAERLARQKGRIVVNGGNCHWPDVCWVHYVHAAHTPVTSGAWWYRAKSRWAHARALRNEAVQIRQARVILCNSERTRRDILTHYPVSDRLTHVVYYGCDLERDRLALPFERCQARQDLGWADDRPRVLFIGALGDHRKGFDTLFAAWRDLCQDRGWDAELIVVGTGTQRASWQQRCLDAGLADRVRFLGFRADVPNILAACDVLVHPVRYEAYGLGVHEALCRGVPALVSASAGVAERYPHELRHLLLANPENHTELAERLHFACKNRELLKVQVEPFGTTLRQHSWDAMAAELVEKMEAIG